MSAQLCSVQPQYKMLRIVVAVVVAAAAEWCVSEYAELKQQLGSSAQMGVEDFDRISCPYVTSHLSERQSLSFSA